MRVLFINPPDTRPADMLADKVRIPVVAPLGLACIAAVLEHHRIEVRIVDCLAEGSLRGRSYNKSGDIRYGMSDAEIADIIRDYRPDTVGVSCLFSNKAWDAHNVCRIAKSVVPHVFTVMGGAHPTALPRETLKDRNVDNVASGEGDFALLSANAIISDLDMLPLPARHLLRMDIYGAGTSPHSGLKRTPVATITTSRGCPANCEFCAIRCLYGKGYRVRSADNVLDEIQHLIQTYGIRELHIQDDNFTADKRRAMAILQGIIDRKWDLTLNSPSGLAVFALDEELLNKMKEAGYYSVSLAIESGVPEVLTLMRKRVNLKGSCELIAYARSIGLKTKAFYILGYPGETQDTMRRTVDFAACDVCADWSLFFPATPLPGTAMEKRVRANGWLADPNMDYRYYFFKANILTPEFDPDFVMALRDQANREVNFEQNINVREGNWDRAKEDFEDVLKLYPDLPYAQEGLRKAQSYGLS